MSDNYLFVILLTTRCVNFKFRKMKTIISTLIVLSTLTIKGQVYPSYGPEIDVTITGLTFDAMEPFVSANGDFLFFNNLNDGVNTKLYYATMVNDSTFSFVGELNGTNQATPPHLDGVADIDASNNFYWTSTRDYPADLDNLFYGKFDSGNVTDIGRVRGDFNKSIPGWLVMDHGISYDGQLLYFNNARFNGVNCQGPCETEIGIAQKVNDSTFNKIPSSDIILQNVNDANYIYYAPCISSDNLEFYYTRFAKGEITPNTIFEVCVAVREAPIEAFSMPKVLFYEPISDLIEAPTLTTDKQIIYYHRKITGSHKVVMRYRENPVSTIAKVEQGKEISIYPNPTNGKVNIEIGLSYHDLKLSVFTLLGERIMSTSKQKEIDVSTLSNGAYFLKFEIDGDVGMEKFIKI